MILVSKKIIFNRKIHKINYTHTIVYKINKNSAYLPMKFYHSRRGRLKLTLHCSGIDCIITRGETISPIVSESIAECSKLYVVPLRNVPRQRRSLDESNFFARAYYATMRRWKVFRDEEKESKDRKKRGEKEELYSEGEIILARHPRDDTSSRFSRLRQYDYSYHVVAIKVSRKEKLMGRATGGWQRRRGFLMRVNYPP